MHWSDRIGRRLNPHDLHIFMVVAEQGNMARAAESLAISRPVVSRTIAGLEQALGVRLLDRTPSGVEPTLYGRALLKRCLAVFDELKQSVLDIESLRDPNAGEVRIGCTEPMAAGFVAAIIDRLSRQYPQLLFQLELCTTPAQQYHVLRERRCDLVVARVWPQTAEADIEVEVLFDDHVCVVVGPGSRWLGHRKLTLAELIDESWLLAPVDNEPGSPVFEIFQAAGLTVPRGRVLSYSLNVRQSLLATGRFLAIIPVSVLRFGPASSAIKVLPCRLPPSSQPVAITVLKNRTLTPIANLFAETARALAQVPRRPTNSRAVSRAAARR
ncbi:MAG TPA: LysR family transcriptional regulator [Xanthobacteraceae bacterium]|nr:LysR family transcriptional regulator [Xanthobacteraceae bacterium]